MRYKWYQLCSGRSIMKDTLLTERCTCSSVSRLPFEGSPWISTYRIFHAYSFAEEVRVFFLSVYNEGHFTWRTKRLFSCISASIRAILLKVYTASSPQIRCKWWMYVWNRPVMKGTLLKRTFLWRDFRQTSYLALSTYALRMVYIWLLSVNDEGTSLREQSSFSSVSGLP
jgi:hypothetical protein